MVDVAVPACWGTDTYALPRFEEQLSAAHLRLTGMYDERLDWGASSATTDHIPSSTWARRIGGRESYGVRFPFAEVLRGLKGGAILSINDHPDIRVMFVGRHAEVLDIPT